MNTVFGRMRLRIISSDIPKRIKAITEYGILLYDVRIENELAAQMTISAKDYHKIKQLLENKGDRIEIIIGANKKLLLNMVKRRWLFVAGILMLLCLTVWIPSRVYFFEIAGNERIPDKRILEVLSQNGLPFGCKRKEINSEKIKNKLLQQMPELDWAGITTKGCLAYISIREKTKNVSEDKESGTISSIVAKCDGVIESVTVTRGYPMCKIGQAVEKGQVLISGFEDCGLLLRGSVAEGEIYAKTIHKKTVITPGIDKVKGKIIRCDRNYTLQIGKKLINLNNSSRISTGSCAKMYDRKNLILPGGFQLPISLNYQEIIYYEPETIDVSETNFEWMDSVLEQYILRNTTAGEILHKTVTPMLMEDRCVLHGTFACREEIGKAKIEEILNYHGKNH